MTSQQLRDDFPTISHHPEYVYFDNASMTQMPKTVVDSLDKYHSHLRVNAHRGAYHPAVTATQEIEKARQTVADFIHAHSSNEVVFTSGASEGIEITISRWAAHNLEDGDEIILGKNDHQSVITPWQDLQKLLADRKIHITLLYYDINTFGEPDIDEILSLVTTNTKLIFLTHVHNIYGTDVEVREIRQKIGHEIILALDATQSISHLEVDVQDLGVQFLVFSGHKMFADTGSGVLWIDQKLHKQINMSTNKAEAMPQLLETGTLHIAGIISLTSAIEWIQRTGKQTIKNRLVELTHYLLSKLRNFQSIEFLPGIAHCRCHEGSGIVAFRVENISSTDIGFYLDEQGIFVRTGDHCSMGIKASDSIRVSMHVYNNEEEIEKFITVLQKIC